jgi:ParB-like chromosome segregation protein Spo0J
MEDEVFSQLKENIKVNGINDPILYCVIDAKKLVIEGHTRFTVAKELKLKDFPTKEIKDKFSSFDDVKLWMLKHQFQRRNLSSVERIQLAILSKDSIEKMAKDNLSKAGKKEGVDIAIDTNEEIAKIAGVGRTSVVRYTSVYQKGSKSLIEKVNKSEISIFSAYNSIKDKPVKKQESNQKLQAQKDIEHIKINSYKDGEDKIKAGVIDCFFVSSNPEGVKNLIKKANVKIGIFKLPKLKSK